MDRKLCAEDALAYSTVRVLAGKNGCAPTSVGTGFLYQVNDKEKNLSKIFIITNKHVIKNSEVIHFKLTHAKTLEEATETKGNNKSSQDITWQLAGNVVNHQSSEVDLCAIDITIPVGSILSTGNKLRSMILDSSWLATQSELEAAKYVEQVLVVGYPRGIWDYHNNLPIARTGTTATHMNENYENKTNFLLDIAAFQGSSGSPVFLYQSPFFRQPDGSISPGTKIKLIGVIWGVIESDIQGEMKIVNVPSSNSSVPVMKSSLNLAIALQASLILDIDAQIFNK